MSQDQQQPLLDGRHADGDQQAAADELSSRVRAVVLGDDAEAGAQVPGDDGPVPEDRYTEVEHYSERANWLRAGVLGANDGLVSVSSIMLGVGAGNADLHTLLLSGLSALVAGALSMGAGEYISVSAQADTETADVEKERDELAKGPSARARALDELIHTYLEKGLEYNLAREVAVALSEKDPVKAYAREELNIDMDELVSPWQAAFSSLISFSLGAAVPLVAGAFIRDPRIRLLSVLVASTAALIVFGAIGAWLGGAHKLRASSRVLVGGWLAMAITFGVGRLFGQGAA